MEESAWEPLSAEDLARPLVELQPLSSPTTPPPPPEPDGFWAGLKERSKNTPQGGTPPGSLGAQAEGDARQTYAQTAKAWKAAFDLAAGNPVDLPKEQAPTLFERVPATQGFTDPKWWASAVGTSVAGSTSFLLGALAGTAAGTTLGAAASGGNPAGAAAGGMIGGMVGGGGVSGLESLGSTYASLRARGVDHESAVDLAIKDGIRSAGINAASIPLAEFGPFRKAISNALLQTFAVQPGVGVIDQVTGQVLKGEEVTTDSIIKAYLMEALFEAEGTVAVATSGKAMADSYAPEPDLDASEPNVGIEAERWQALRAAGISDPRQMVQAAYNTQSRTPLADLDEAEFNQLLGEVQGYAKDLKAEDEATRKATYDELVQWAQEGEGAARATENGPVDDTGRETEAFGENRQRDEAARKAQQEQERARKAEEARKAQEEAARAAQEQDKRQEAQKAQQETVALRDRLVAGGMDPVEVAKTPARDLGRAVLVQLGVPAGKVKKWSQATVRQALNVQDLWDKGDQGYFDAAEELRAKGLTHNAQTGGFADTGMQDEGGGETPAATPPPAASSSSQPIDGKGRQELLSRIKGAGHTPSVWLKANFPESSLARMTGADYENALAILDNEKAQAEKGQKAFEANRPLVTYKTKGARLEVVVGEGERGPEDMARELLAARFRYSPKQGRWYAALAGEGVTPEIAQARLDLAKRLSEPAPETVAPPQNLGVVEEAKVEPAPIQEPEPEKAAESEPQAEPQGGIHEQVGSQALSPAQEAAAPASETPPQDSGTEETPEPAPEPPAPEAQAEPASAAPQAKGDMDSLHRLSQNLGRLEADLFQKNQDVESARQRVADIEAGGGRPKTTKAWKTATTALEVRTIEANKIKAEMDRLRALYPTEAHDLENYVNKGLELPPERKALYESEDTEVAIEEPKFDLGQGLDEMGASIEEAKAAEAEAARREQAQVDARAAEAEARSQAAQRANLTEDDVAALEDEKDDAQKRVTEIEEKIGHLERQATTVGPKSKFQKTISTALAKHRADLETWQEVAADREQRIAEARAILAEREGGEAPAPAQEAPVAQAEPATPPAQPPNPEGRAQVEVAQKAYDEAFARHTEATNAADEASQKVEAQVKKATDSRLAAAGLTARKQKNFAKYGNQIEDIKASVRRDYADQIENAKRLAAQAAEANTAKREAREALDKLVAQTMGAKEGQVWVSRRQGGERALRVVAVDGGNIQVEEGTHRFKEAGAPETKFEKSGYAYPHSASALAEDFYPAEQHLAENLAHEQRREELNRQIETLDTDGVPRETREAVREAKNHVRSGALEPAQKAIEVGQQYLRAAKAKAAAEARTLHEGLFETQVERAPANPPQEADFIFRPPMDAEMAAAQGMKGERAKVTVMIGSKEEATPKDITGKRYGNWAVVKAPEVYLKEKSGWVVVHGATHRTVGGEIFATELDAKMAIHRLEQMAGVDWSQGDVVEKMSPEQQEEAGNRLRGLMEKDGGSTQGQLNITKNEYSRLTEVFRNLAQADPDFRSNPVMTVTSLPADGSVQLTWRKENPTQGGTRIYTFSAKLGPEIEGSLPKIGQTVRISTNFLNGLGVPPARVDYIAKGQMAGLEGSARGTTMADYGEAPETAASALPGGSQRGDTTPTPAPKPLAGPPGPAMLHGVAGPELYQLAKAILGTPPEARRLRNGVRGLFRYGIPDRPKGEIEVALDAAGDEAALLRTLAHEIGHAVDYLPESLNLSGKGGKGNLLGRLLVIRQTNFRKEVFTGINWQRAVKGELVALSEWWRPYDKAKASAAFKKYRGSPEELYADMVSVFLNAPLELKTRAPVTYQLFTQYLNRKPEIQAAYLEAQMILNGTPEDLAKVRAANLSEMFTDSDQTISIVARMKQMAMANLHAGIGQMLEMGLIAKEAGDIAVGRERERSGFDSRATEAVRAIYEDLQKKENPNHLMLRAMQDEVILPLHDAGFGKGDLEGWSARHALGQYLMMRRIVDERGDILNPLGWTPTPAQEHLDELQKLFGPDRWQALLRAAENFDNITFSVARNAYESGVISQKTWNDTIVPNRNNYATFVVVHHLETDDVSGRMLREQGTFSAIANPFEGTVMKLMAMNRLAETNRAKRSIRDFMAQDKDTAWETVNLVGDSRQPDKNPASDQRMMYLMENGRLQAYLVPMNTALAFSNHDIGSIATFASRWIHRPTYKYIHPLYVTFSPAFVAANLPRDFGRTWRNLAAIGAVNEQRVYTQMIGRGFSKKEARAQAKAQRISFADVLAAYVKALPTAVKRAQGIEDAKIQELYKAKALSIPFVDIFAEANNTLDHDKFEKKLREVKAEYARQNNGKEMPRKEAERAALSDKAVWIDEAYYRNLLARYQINTDPRMAWSEKGYRQKAASIISALPRLIEAAGVVTETLPKVAAWDLLTERGVKGTTRKRAVNTKAGTPNYQQRGLWTPVTNAVFMYSKVRWVGMAADAELAFDSKSAGAWWWRFMVAGVMPKIMARAALTAAGAALLKPDEDDPEWADHLKGAALGTALAPGAGTVVGAVGGASWLKEMGEMFKAIPDYFLANYDVVPLGWTTDEEDGKKKAIFLTLPQDDLSAFVGRVVWHSLKAGQVAMEGQMAAGTTYTQEIENLVGDIWGELVPGMPPVLSLPSAYLQYAAGHNPYDPHYGEGVVSQSDWKARTAPGNYEALKDLGIFTVNKFGIASAIFNAGATVAGEALDIPFQENRATMLESRMKNYAGLAGLGRFLRMSNDGISERQYALASQTEAERFDRGSRRPQIAKDLQQELRLLRDPKVRLEGDKDTQARAELLKRWDAAVYSPLNEAINAFEQLGDEDQAEALRKTLEAQSKKSAIESLKAEKSYEAVAAANREVRDDVVPLAVDPRLLSDEQLRQVVAKQHARAQAPSLTPAQRQAARANILRIVGGRFGGHQKYLDSMPPEEMSKYLKLYERTKNSLAK